MINQIRYHEKIKNEQHIFLCAVSGRTSSTALQRIINSSNEVWLWGEPHGLLKQLFFLISKANFLAKDDKVKLALHNMYYSYRDNKHTLFYANATGNIDPLVQSMTSTISLFLKPWAPKLKRFGFKEIDFMPLAMIELLKETYPKSIFVFCFRDPLQQWPSLCKLKLPVSTSLVYFLQQYQLIATTYMAFAKKHKVMAFIENQDIKEMEKVNKIIKYLNISEIDPTLIGLTVHTLKHKRLSKSDKSKILESSAYKSYLKMKKISNSFYK